MQIVSKVCWCNNLKWVNLLFFVNLILSFIFLEFKLILFYYHTRIFLILLLLPVFSSLVPAVVGHTYQPLQSGRIWDKVNF